MPGASHFCHPERNGVQRRISVAHEVEILHSAIATFRMTFAKVGCTHPHASPPLRSATGHPQIAPSVGSRAAERPGRGGLGEIEIPPVADLAFADSPKHSSNFHIGKGMASSPEKVFGTVPIYPET
jgi:hypothetical protein